MPDETLSAVNINELPVVEEIKSGSYVLVETTDGTGIIDYKNFIIGTDNITFSDLLSTQDAQIQALSAQVQAMSTIVTAITSLSNFDVGQTGWNS